MFTDIDGSYLEGGGQIIRTAVALSCVTGKAVRILNIRANRPQPGLKAQHLKGIEAAAKLCNAKVSGLNIGSARVEFTPGEIRSGSLSINIGTAGSIGLVLQTLMIPAIHCEGKVELHVTGGTDVSWSPSIGFMQNVKLPVLRRMGYSGEITLERRGYYPKGGGSVTAVIEPGELKTINLTEQTRPKSIRGLSHASRSLEKASVAERQMKAARKLLFDSLGLSPDIGKEYSDTLCPGSGIDLWIETENSVLGSSSFGKPGKRAEEVGSEAAESLLKQFGSGACLDEHMGDQIIPYMALAKKGESSVTVPELTGHIRTNIWVTEKLLPVKFSAKRQGDAWRIECRQSES